MGQSRPSPIDPRVRRWRGRSSWGPARRPGGESLGLTLFPLNWESHSRKPGNLGTRVATGTRRVTRTVFLLYDWARYRLVSRRHHVRLGPWSKGHIYASAIFPTGSIWVFAHTRFGRLFQHEPPRLNLRTRLNLRVSSESR